MFGPQNLALCFGLKMRQKQVRGTFRKVYQTCFCAISAVCWQRLLNNANFFRNAEDVFTGIFETLWASGLVTPPTFGVTSMVSFFVEYNVREQRFSTFGMA